MNYLEIKKLIKDNGLELSISLDIASCVCAATSDNEINDDEFVMLCNYVRNIWDDVEKAYTQLIADVVVDCFRHCFDYWQCRDINLSYDDLKHLNKIDDVINAYYNKYYE